MKNDILPIFITKLGNKREVIEFCGTGFIIAPQLFMTCWHCVKAVLSEGYNYSAFLVKDDNYIPYALENICQDENGMDLAFANIKLNPTLNFELSDKPLDTGTYVYTYGYPLTSKTKNEKGDIKFDLQARCLQGYITRPFLNKHGDYGSVLSYELDMPAPEGLSGAPLFQRETNKVIGMVYGMNKVATIEQFSIIDPITKEKSPEIQRTVCFALAHYTKNLTDARCKLTKGKKLFDYINS